MIDLLECPRCLHVCKVADDRLEHEVRCAACNFTFKPTRGDIIRHESEPEHAWASGDEPGWLQAVRRVGGDPGAMAHGVAGGIIAGVIAGVVLGGLAGAWGESPGGAVGGAVVGLVLGFAIGVIAGMAVGAARGVFDHVFTLTGGRAAVLSGMLTASAVALQAGGRTWVPAGAGIGLASGLVWYVAVLWADSYVPVMRELDGLGTRREDEHVHANN